MTGRDVPTPEEVAETTGASVELLRRAREAVADREADVSERERKEAAVTGEGPWADRGEEYTIGRDGSHPVPVYYVPGAVNRYEPQHNVIVLDASLREYPDAHDHVLQHEIGHSREQNQSLRGFISYELQHDLEYHFSNDDAIKQAQKYYGEQEEAAPDEVVIGNALRDLWNMVLIPTGVIYRSVIGWFEDGWER